MKNFAHYYAILSLVSLIYPISTGKKKEEIESLILVISIRKRYKRKGSLGIFQRKWWI